MNHKKVIVLIVITVLVVGCVMYDKRQKAMLAAGNVATPDTSGTGKPIAVDPPVNQYKTPPIMDPNQLPGNKNVLPNATA